MRAMRRQPAAEAYQRAVIADPTFALAWYRLAIASLWSGQSHQARAASARAVQNAARLSGRDREVLEAFDASLRGANQEAAQRFRGMGGPHPEDVGAGYQLSEVLFHCAGLRGRRPERSRQAWERLLELDPRHAAAIAHLSAIEATEGRWDAF